MVRPDVYLHVGLPKTGTTYLQQVLWNSRRELAREGVLVPGETRGDQSQAVWDLLGRRPRDADLPRVAASWDSLVASAQAWTGTHVVVSQELLSAASPRQAARAVRAFAPSRVHVVVTLRDLERVVVAAWQQEMIKGRTWSLAEFAAAVRNPSESPSTAGVSFWLRQDVVRLLDRWEHAVPRSRVHLVTVPPRGAPQEQLVERFAVATALPLSALDCDLEPMNESVGLAETEVLRRLNDRLDGALNERQYVRVVKRGIHPAMQARSSTKMSFPAVNRSWAVDTSRATVDTLRSRGYAVAGDLDDLLPAAGTEPGGQASEAPDREVADAALDALESVVRQYADSWWRSRSKDRKSSAGVSQRLASSRRAQGYRAKLAVLGLAERSRAVRWLIARRVHR